MNGHSNRTASAVLSALVYAQVGLCLIALVFVALKDRAQTTPVVVAAVETPGVQAVN